MSLVALTLGVATLGVFLFAFTSPALRLSGLSGLLVRVGFIAAIANMTIELGLITPAEGFKAVNYLLAIVGIFSTLRVVNGSYTKLVRDVADLERQLKK